MALLTAAQLMEHVETDRSDEVLTALIADAEATINSRFGTLSTITSTTFFDDSSLVSPRVIYLDRAIGTIASVKETSGDVEVTLASNDYELLYGGRAIRRLFSGTHAQTVWARRVDIVYDAASDQAQRVRICVDLVKLALRWNGARDVSTGNVRESLYDDYEVQRDVILSALAPVMAFS